MHYEYRKRGRVTYRVRAIAKKQNGERRQDEFGRFYCDATEKTKASGNMIELHLWISREDPEIGIVVSQKIWICGGINNRNLGPKRWQRFLEDNLDELLDKAIKRYKKTYNNNTIQLVMFEGWKIIRKKVINLSDCVYYPTVQTVRSKLSKEEQKKIVGYGT